MRAILAGIGRFLVGLLALAATIIALVVIVKLAGKFFGSMGSVPSLPPPSTPSTPTTPPWVTPTGSVNWDWIMYLISGLILLIFLIRALAHEGATGKKSVSLILVSSATVAIFVGLIRLSGYQVLNKIASVSPSMASILSAIPFGPEIGFVLFGILLIFLRARTDSSLRRVVDMLAIANFIGGGIWIFMLAGKYFIIYLIPMMEKMWYSTLGIHLTKHIRVGLFVIMLSAMLLWKFHSTKWLIWLPMVVFLLFGASIVYTDLASQGVVSSRGLPKELGDMWGLWMKHLDLSIDQEEWKLEKEKNQLEKDKFKYYHPTPKPAPKVVERQPDPSPQKRYEPPIIVQEEPIPYYQRRHNPRVKPLFPDGGGPYSQRF